MIQHLGGGRKLDLGPSRGRTKAEPSFGGRPVSDPLAFGARTTGGSLLVRNGFGRERPSVWVKMRGGPTG